MPNPGDEPAAGDVPEEMTPEILRHVWEPDRLLCEASLNAAASAWEADIQRGANIATELARQLKTAEAHIEALAAEEERS